MFDWISVISCRLIESPYKVVLEQLLGLQPSTVKTKDEENQAILQHPLEICLKHSTIHTPDASKCPLVQLQPGVAALHEYADWITELNEKQSNRDRKRTTECLHDWPHHSVSETYVACGLFH